MNFTKLLLLFTLVPLVELALFMALADIISLPVTLAIIVVTGALGAYLTKAQGMLALRNFQKALSAGKLPHVEATDGILILLAGAVLLTPGFLTDTIGFTLLIPPARALVRSRFALHLKRYIHTSVRTGHPDQSPRAADQMKQAQGRVVSEER